MLEPNVYHQQIAVIFNKNGSYKGFDDTYGKIRNKSNLFENMKCYTTEILVSNIGICITIFGLTNFKLVFNVVMN